MNAVPTRNLAMELVRVTEAAALAAGRHMGRGEKNAADKAAVDAMRLMLNTIDMNAVIVIGEGEKDEAPMLFNGERVGTGAMPEMDIAVDPIDGTRPLSNGQPNSISTVAIAPRGTMFDPGPFLYMDKIAVGPAAKGLIDIEAPVTDNLKKIARAQDAELEDVTVVILDRPRHGHAPDELAHLEHALPRDHLRRHRRRSDDDQFRHHDQQRPHGTRPRAGRLVVAGRGICRDVHPRSCRQYFCRRGA